MQQLFDNKLLRDQMGVNARIRFETTFDLDLMVDSYRQLMIQVVSPVVLLDIPHTNNNITTNTTTTTTTNTTNTTSYTHTNTNTTTNTYPPLYTIKSPLYPP
ncbi:hypothetical protein B484DRAFT_241174 [Ochromonadaceae sp. CCMP2298]|nr:hypothetical protein B484DRAFT_241174 [Ochromonadaceae sp. CCMP2298]